MAPRGIRRKTETAKGLRAGPQRQRALPLPLPAVEADALWQEGGTILYLGTCLRLQLTDQGDGVRREGECLLLPLPPEADARQIRDAVTSWLQREALALFQRLVSESSGCEVTLAYGRDPPWVRREGGRLRCHWRLIEQPLAVIERQIAACLMPQGRTMNLFETP